MAKKIYMAEMIYRSANEGAAMNLRMATIQIAGMRVPPRVRQVPEMRKKISVTVITEQPLGIAIKKGQPQFDRVITEVRPTQSQRV